MNNRRNQNKITGIALALCITGVLLTLISVLMMTGVIHPKIDEPTQDTETSTEEATQASTEESTEAPTEPIEVDLCATGKHYPIVIVGKPATCTESGTTDKIICEKCGFTLKGSEEAPATNHANREVKEICIESNVGCAFPAFFHCPDCGQNFYDTLKASDIGMPIVHMIGSLQGADLTAKVKMQIEYYGEDQEFQADMLCKYQGQSSFLYPKKNYSVTLYQKGTNYEKKQKVVLFEDHKESKYILKANFVDASAGRNIIAARIYKQVAATRDNGDEISQLETKAVIDGFPILLYMNGEFQGLYTLNEPRDKWLYDMHDSETTREAALFSRQFKDTNKLKTHIVGMDDPEQYNWKMEYASTEDFPKIGTQWAIDSFNGMIDVLNSYNDADLKKYLPNFVNIDRAIDCLIYTLYLNCYDNRCKNNLYLTWDGVKWSLTMYDMDATFSLNFDGHNFLPYDYSADYTIGAGTVLYQKLKKLWWPEIKARYWELRESVLTYDNSKAEIDRWFDAIPAVCFQADYKRNPDIPQKNVDHRGQMIGFVGERLKYLDAYFK